MEEHAGQLRQTALLCRSFARWHRGEAAINLQRLADDLDSTAEALESAAKTALGAQSPGRGLLDG